MLKNNARWRNVFIPLAGCVLMFAGGNVFAEWWGYNAPPCSNGHCAPVTPWGYTPPHWHRWPAAIYPDMIKPASSTPSGEEVSPSIEIPPPNKEAEMQTAPPSREPARGTESPSTLPGQGNDMMNAPTPARQSDQLKLNDNPPLRNAPGAQPPTIDPFGPPSTNEPSTVPPPGRSSAIPKVRVQAGVLPSTSFMPEKMDLRGQRWTSSESRDIELTSPARVRIANDRFNRSIVPDQEPDMLIPSLSTRPLASSSPDVRGIRIANGNPLRSELSTGAAQMATYVEPEPIAIEENHVSTSAASASAAKANPLRR